MTAATSVQMPIPFEVTRWLGIVTEIDRSVLEPGIRPEERVTDISKVIPSRGYCQVVTVSPVAYSKNGRDAWVGTPSAACTAALVMPRRSSPIVSVDIENP